MREKRERGRGRGRGRLRGRLRGRGRGRGRGRERERGRHRRVAERRQRGREGERSPFCPRLLEALGKSLCIRLPTSSKILCLVSFAKLSANAISCRCIENTLPYIFQQARPLAAWSQEWQSPGLGASMRAGFVSVSNGAGHQGPGVEDHEHSTKPRSRFSDHEHMKFNPPPHAPLAAHGCTLDHARSRSGRHPTTA